MINIPIKEARLIGYHRKKSTPIKRGIVRIRIIEKVLLSVEVIARIVKYDCKISKMRRNISKGILSGLKYRIVSDERSL